MNTQMTGWFRVASSNPKFGDSLCYSCNACGVGYIFFSEAQEPRVYCCNQWLTKPREGWLSKLAIVQAQPVRGMTVLPGNNIDFGLDPDQGSGNRC